MTVCETEPVTVKELIHRKPSLVVRATIHGLQTASTREDFRLNMNTFGDTGKSGDKRVCIGCMATCAMQSLFNVTFTASNIDSAARRANVAGLTHNPFGDYYDLEVAVDRVRQGLTSKLYNICGITWGEWPNLPAEVPAVSRQDKTYAANAIGVVLAGVPSTTELEVAIERLTLLAEQLEAKGF